MECPHIIRSCMIDPKAYIAENVDWHVIEMVRSLDELKRYLTVVHGYEDVADQIQKILDEWHFCVLAGCKHEGDCIYNKNKWE